MEVDVLFFLLLLLFVVVEDLARGDLTFRDGTQKDVLQRLLQRRRRRRSRDEKGSSRLLHLFFFLLIAKSLVCDTGRFAPSPPPFLCTRKNKGGIEVLVAG